MIRKLLLALLLVSPAPMLALDVTLTAAPATVEVAPGVTMSAWAYNGTVPGPVLRYHQGDTVRVTLVNDLPEATSIHWHGIPVPNGMDGVPGVSAPAVQPGQSFTYVFTAPPPGTYWYHPHADSAYQIGAGLYGLLIVDPPAGTSVAWTREALVVIGEQWNGMMSSSGMGGMGSGMPGMPGSGPRMPVAPRAGAMMAGALLINGKTAPAIPDISVQRGEKVLFRFVNTGDMVHPMHVHGMHWLVTASDGFDLSSPYAKDTLPVNAGERYDAILDADNPGIWMVHCHNLMHVGESAAGMTGLVFRLIVQ